jgi:hypothetical protein
MLIANAGPLAISAASTATQADERARFFMRAIFARFARWTRTTA